MLYKHLAKYNDGYSYNMMFVGPGWLNRRGRWEAPYELLAKSYEDGMKYYGKLKAEGKLEDMTMSEFADYYREKHPNYKTAECALWKDILYGSNKQYFWYADPYFRTCLDFNQGGAMIDLRPYVARIPQECGHRDCSDDCSYRYSGTDWNEHLLRRREYSRDSSKKSVRGNSRLGDTTHPLVILENHLDCQYRGSTCYDMAGAGAALVRPGDHSGLGLVRGPRHCPLLCHLPPGRPLADPARCPYQPCRGIKERVNNIGK